MSSAGFKWQGQKTLGMRSGPDPLQITTLSSHQNNTGLWESRQPFAQYSAERGGLMKKGLVSASAISASSNNTVTLTAHPDGLVSPRIDDMRMAGLTDANCLFISAGGSQ
jgi:hypothetical protein